MIISVLCKEYIHLYYLAFCLKWHSTYFANKILFHVITNSLLLKSGILFKVMKLQPDNPRQNWLNVQKCLTSKLHIEIYFAKHSFECNGKQLESNSIKFHCKVFHSFNNKRCNTESTEFHAHTAWNDRITKMKFCCKFVNESYFALDLEQSKSNVHESPKWKAMKSNEKVQTWQLNEWQKHRHFRCVSLFSFKMPAYNLIIVNKSFAESWCHR